MAFFKSKKADSFIYLDFEEKIKQIDKQIFELEKISHKKGIDFSIEILGFENKKEECLEKIYSNLSPWQVVNVARHPNRPQFCDYLENIVTDFCELHGDRAFGDDKALTTGFGRIGSTKALIIGQNKGKSTEEKIKYNFGCMHPEGYRKTLHKMKLAGKYGIPVITFIDTPGAYPGVGAEERGIATAIAINLREMSSLKTPILSIVIGEGGSGGALGIGVCDNLSMLEFSYYSVISPEGCAGILWKDGKNAKEAAEALKLTSKELFSLGLIDYVIKEPIGGAHRDYNATFSNVRGHIIRALEVLNKYDLNSLVKSRYDKLRKIGSDTIISMNNLKP
jgi:acetyl-CoA carboxylase carboxyl transferase subunit alpha